MKLRLHTCFSFYLFKGSLGIYICEQYEGYDLYFLENAIPMKQAAFWRKTLNSWFIVIQYKLCLHT